MGRNYLRFFFEIFACGGFWCASALFAFAENEEKGPAENKRVIVVANSADPDSVDIAKHYMRARKIPGANLIELPMPTAETITWKDFAEKVFSPLRRELADRRLIDGDVKKNAETDPCGRVQLTLPRNFKPEEAKTAEKISYLVLCRGVPLRIANDASKMPPLPEPKSPDAPKLKHSPFAVNCAAVDSELALLAVPDTEIKGSIPNPFFKNNREKGAAVAKMYLRVARLDGITADDAKALVDNAIAAEKKGLLGRAYIDIGGPHAQGDRWLDKCAEQTVALGFDTSVERSRALMAASARYDAPALYFGWYSGSVGGFFLDKKFRFPPGAVAIHIHSYSATSMRSKTAWTPGLVTRGVTATVGNVYEPYLGMTHYPHFFLEALAEGKSAGEAAAYSLPVFSWQNVFVGDPLYSPFTKSVEAQMSDAMQMPTRFSQYAFIRAAKLAAASGDMEKSALILRNGSLFSPGLALNYLIAEKEVALKGACSQRIPVRVPAHENPGLLLESARLLAKSLRAEDALKIYSDLLERNLVPEIVREKVLREAYELARARNDSSRVAKWFSELERLAAAKKKAAEKSKK